MEKADTAESKLAWLRTMVAISLPQIAVNSPEAYTRLELALQETVLPSSAGFAALRMLLPPQAMGRSHIVEESSTHD